jgi:hypothetical protein
MTRRHGLVVRLWSAVCWPSLSSPGNSCGLCTSGGRYGTVARRPTTRPARVPIVEGVLAGWTSKATEGSAPAPSRSTRWGFRAKRGGSRTRPSLVTHEPDPDADVIHEMAASW